MSLGELPIGLHIARSVCHPCAAVRFLRSLWEILRVVDSGCPCLPLWDNYDGIARSIVLQEGGLGHLWEFR